MLNIHDEPNTGISVSALQKEERKETTTGKRPAARNQHRSRRWLGIVKGYPIPFVVVTLMLASLVLWLAGRGVIAYWTLLAVALLGGAPLLWETLRQLFHREFGVDLIAILAIAGSIFLGQYLAGALVVLMMSGGEALEAFALRRALLPLGAGRARSAQCAPLAR